MFFDYENSTDLEKFNNSVAATLDEIKLYIDKLVDTLDIDFCPKDKLYIIANLLGYELNREDDPDFQRRQLKSVIDSYKAKGTSDSIKILFYTLGVNVEVVPLWTPDFKQEVSLVPPYIQIVGTNQNPTGTFDVIVINPDEQLDTETQAYSYV